MWGAGSEAWGAGLNIWEWLFPPMLGRDSRHGTRSLTHNVSFNVSQLLVLQTRKQRFREVKEFLKVP